MNIAPPEAPVLTAISPYPPPPPTPQYVPTASPIGDERLGFSALAFNWGGFFAQAAAAAAGGWIGVAPAREDSRGRYF